MEPFDPKNKDHRIICQAAIAAADALGLGRITACKEQLELNDIRAYSTPKEQDEFQLFVQEIGRNQ